MIEAQVLQIGEISSNQCAGGICEVIGRLRGNCEMEI